MSHRTRTVLVSAFIAATLAVTGCGSDRKTPTKPDAPVVPGAPTPEALLDRFGEAYRAQNLEDYAALLHSAFTFEPSPEDQHVDFTSLDRTQDLAAHAAMFADVREILVTLDHDGARPSEEEAYPSGEGYLQIVVPAVRLDVRSNDIDEVSGLFITYRVSGDPVVFTFAPNDADSPTHYTLVHMTDLFHMIGTTPERSHEEISLPVIEYSWGGIKARYLRDAPPVE